MPKAADAYKGKRRWRPRKIASIGEAGRGRIVLYASLQATTPRCILLLYNTDNADGTLLPGMYSTVSLKVQRAGAPLLVPSTAVLVQADGLRLAVVEKGHIHWRKVEIDADLGPMMAISTGLFEGDEVVVSPSDRLVEGDMITPHEEARK